MRHLALALSLAFAGCRADAAAKPDASPDEPPWSGLTLDLTPDPARGEVRVAVRVSGARAAGVRELSVARAWADTHGAAAVLGPRAADGEGDIPLVPRADDGGPDDVYALSRAPRGGEIVVRYRAAATTGRSRFALRVAPDRMSGVGHAFLLLPRLDDPLPARVRIHTGAFPRGADAASSFGFGATMVTDATSEELAHAVYVAGMLWRETGEGAGDLVVLGDPPFDTRRAFDDARAAGHAVNRFFLGAGASPDPLRLLLVAEPGLGAAHDGAYLTRSIGVWFDARQRLDGELELVLGHELAHRFLGGAVRLVGKDGREATWFAEGFTVHAARRAMQEAGLLAPADLAADLNRALAPGGEGGGAEQLPAEYRRGARLAAWLDASLAHAHGAPAAPGGRSLGDVLRALVAVGGALPVSVLVDALRKAAPAIGGALAAAVERVDAGGEPPGDLPDDAFGPCVRPRVREGSAFDLGLDRASLGGHPAMVRGLVRGSAAERAGLREGALVVRARVPSEADTMGSARAEVELVLGDGRRVRYRPVVTRRDAVWEAASGACPAATRP